jgi:predicted nucleotidyltransferase component of viral defense system
VNRLFIDAARLLTQVAPFVFESGVFALKGGTAINLFVRDMPRLSVDLDLVFPDHSLPRDKALARINEAIRRAADRLRTRGFQVRTVTATGAGETKILVRRGSTEIKVEVNFVLRGTVHPVRPASLSAKARDILQAELEIPMVSLEDLYGGKLVAAMDRQHPRDLFDVMQLYANEGITPAIRRAFVVYLASHNRPLHEVLSPVPRDISQDYERTFVGMTTEPIEFVELLNVRDRLMTELPRTLDSNERQFLLSLVSNKPEWPLLNLAHLEQLPAIRWKLKNLEQLAKTSPKKFAEQADALKRLLG